MAGPSYSSNTFDQTSLNLLRSGTVVNRRMGGNGPEVQVSYPDRDPAYVSDWLPIGSQCSAGATMFSLPRLGTNVTVGHFGTGIEQGIVLCSNPTNDGGGIIPNSPNSVAMLADDGAQFEYNPDSSTLNLLGMMAVYLAAGGVINIAAGGNINITSGGTVKITAPLINANGVLIDSSGNVTIPGTLTVKGTTELMQAFANPNCGNADGSGGGT